MEILRSTERIARKDYNCDASLWITDSGILQERKFFSIKDLRTLVKVRNDKWKILKGMKYHEQVIKDGSLYTVRGRLDIIDICQRYDLFEND